MDDFAGDSPLARELHSLVQPKLQECGWTTGGDDTTLFDYILLMLANDKNESQVASELSNDLLDLGPENVETQQFSRWLFEQIEVLRQRFNGGNTGGDNQIANTTEIQTVDASNDVPANVQDTEMEGATEPSAGGSIPTGPKAMRNGSGAKTARGGRMLNQMNKNMGRQDDALHRVRGSQGVGRVNSHTREPPKGPRTGSNVGRGLDALAGGRGLNNMNLVPNGMPGMSGAMPGMPMAGVGQPGMPPMLNQSQQMALMQMYEQQANMMQQIFSGQMPQPFVNPNFPQGRGGKKFSGGNRGNGPANKQNLPSSTKFPKKDEQDESMTDGPAAENGEQGQNSRPDPSNTMCNFNQRCAKADCPYVHTSPVAPKTTVVDMSTTCTFGAACVNKKCVGKHPSPAQKAQYQAEQECFFYPNCRDPQNCPYSHPTSPPCRNGADCATPGCSFFHSKITCKYNPCTKPGCMFKHVEGQKKVDKRSNKWVAPGNGEDAHVSERKFVDESKEEELVIPGENAEMKNAEMEVAL
ncbi:hypothetical protein P280DRAFT_469870 [Massarina eburnea CBS 473.64]|uniref:Nab2-like CCCH zinc finger domain-containing protein n=1 Tax=Massarina eburnea CBS 473.64 TaxID=1395130 RepID=A0A6A6RYJ4_9PLEO|nr:hypothetical protein P280DRAFT_469870 [Massarina eburnea CBS 473.64]